MLFLELYEWDIYNFTLRNCCNFPWASWPSDQPIGTKLVLAHKSSHIKISDFWQYFFYHHRWTNWATENPQPYRERRYSQLSSAGCRFSLAHLIFQWWSKQNYQKSPILMWNLKENQNRRFLAILFWLPLANQICYKKSTSI